MDPYTAAVTGDDSLPDELGRREAAPEPIPNPPTNRPEATGGQSGTSGGQTAPPTLPQKIWEETLDDLNASHAKCGTQKNRRSKTLAEALKRNMAAKWLI